MADVCLALNSYQEVGRAATSPLATRRLQLCNKHHPAAGQSLGSAGAILAR